jgi:hypothetical protein
MGTTTHGWAEYRWEEWAADPMEADGWRGIINLRAMLGQGELFYGGLFGVQNPSAFEPVAASRGLPTPMSAIAELDYQHTPGERATWISLAEIQEIDWEAEADLTALESRTDWYRAVRRTEKWSPSGDLLAEEVDVWDELPPEKISKLAAEREVAHDNYGYRVVPKRRGEVAVHDWPTLLTWLDVIEHRWEIDPANIRLVVWFTDLPEE